MAKKTPEDGKEYKVGDAIKAKLHDGRIADATIRAISQQEGKVKLQVDYGHEETTTIELWQVIEKIK